MGGCDGRNDVRHARLKSVHGPARVSLLENGESFWSERLRKERDEDETAADEFVQGVLDDQGQFVEVVELLSGLLCTKMKLQQRNGYKIVLELENCKTLRRWLHKENVDVSESWVGGIGGWLSGIWELRDHLLRLTFQQPGQLIFLLCSLVDGLLSSDSKICGIVSEIIVYWINTVLDSPSYMVFQGLLMDWLCSPTTFGLEYMVLGGAKEHDHNLARTVLRIFQMDYYKLFSRRILGLGNDGSTYGQYICQYFRYCTFLMGCEMKHVVKKDLLDSTIVDKLATLSLQVLETALLVKPDDVANKVPLQGKFLVCTARPTSPCMHQLIQFLRVLMKQFPDAVHGRFPKQILQMFTLVPSYVETRDSRMARALIELFFDLAWFATGNNDSKFIRVCFKMISSFGDSMRFVTILCNRLVEFSEHLSTDLIMQNIRKEIESTKCTYYSLLMDMTNQLLDTSVSPQVLVELVEVLGARTLQQTKMLEIPAETQLNIHVTLRILTDSSIGMTLPVREFRSHFLNRCIDELEKRHQQTTSAEELQNIRKLSPLRKGHNNGKNRSYLSKYQQNEDDFDTSKSTKCQVCFETDGDRALFNFTQSLAMFEAEVNVARDILDRLLWSNCNKIQTIFDQTSSFVHDKRVLKLEPIPGSPKPSYEDADIFGDIGFISSSSNGYEQSRNIDFGFSPRGRANLLHDDLSMLQSTHSFSSSSSSSSSSRSSSSTNASSTGTSDAEVDEEEKGQTLGEGIKPVQIDNKKQRKEFNKALEIKAKKEIQKIQAAAKAKRIQVEQAKTEKLEQEQKRDVHLRRNFEQQRGKWKEKREQVLHEKFVSEEIRKEYLDLKETSPCVERGFEAELAEDQAKWNGVKHIARDIANLVSETVAPYTESLRRLFHMFASKGGVEKGQSFQSMSNDCNKMSSKEWVSFLNAFKIVPQNMHANHAIDIFHKCPNMGTGGSEMSYLEFLHGLRLISLDDDVLDRLWITSGFDAITAARKPSELKPHWFESQRKQSSLHPGACPTIRFQVICEQLRRCALNDFRLGKCLGTWPKRAQVFPENEIRVFNPSVVVAIDIIDDIIDSVFGAKFFIVGSETSYSYDLPKEHVLHKKSRLLQPKVYGTKQPISKEVMKPVNNHTNNFAYWLKKQKEIIKPKKGNVLDTEECARVLWRLIGKVESNTKASHLTKSLEKGAEKYRNKARADLMEDRKRKQGIEDKEKLKRNQRLYEKERAERVRVAAEERERKLEAQRKQEQEEAEALERKKKLKMQRQDLLKAKLNTRLLKEKKKKKKPKHEEETKQVETQKEDDASGQQQLNDDKDDKQQLNDDADEKQQLGNDDDDENQQGNNDTDEKQQLGTDDEDENLQGSNEEETLDMTQEPAEEEQVEVENFNANDVIENREEQETKPREEEIPSKKPEANVDDEQPVVFETENES